mmetsp:Transcript_8229/g.10769  ORF Transcript_8229/g.10769 Transcript_8229/m.10769 type:complete len:298 (-) Transcript_8229:73-966(-)
MNYPSSRITSPYSLLSNKPNDNDVLCSKDKSFSNHHGNLLFRERVDSMTEQYLRSRSKTEKMQMTKDAVLYLYETYGSRFMKKIDGVWVEINSQAARDKVSHALRFAAKKEAKPSKSKPTAPKASQVRKQHRQKEQQALTLEQAAHLKPQKTLDSTSLTGKHDNYRTPFSSGLGDYLLDDILARQKNILNMMTRYQCDIVHMSTKVADPLQSQDESQTKVGAIPLYVNVPTINAALTPIEPFELDVDSQEKLLQTPSFTFETGLGLLEGDDDIAFLSHAEAALETNNDQQMDHIHAI